MTDTRYTFAKYQTEDPFTRVPRAAIRDTTLDLKARGLLLVMLDKPANWRFTEQNLAAECGVSRDQLRTAITTLIESGYVRRRRVPGPSGQPTVVLTEVTDLANCWPDAEGLVSQPPGGLVSGRRETQLHKNEGGKNEVEVQEPSSTDVDHPGLELVEAEPADDGFDAAWEAYPKRNGRKVEKAKAKRRWQRMSVTERQQVLTAIANYRTQHAPTGEGPYVKDMHRFLVTDVWSEYLSPSSSPSPGRQLTPLEQVLGEGWG
jgi:hypothetical protein